MGILRGGGVVSLVYILVLVMLGEGIGGFSLIACETMELILFLTASLVFVARVKSLSPPFEREEERLLLLMGVVFYSSKNMSP
jgi:hypothetical protein